MARDTATAPYELRFDAGRCCLDLLATSHPYEHLDAVGPLCAWITGAGLVPPGTPLGHADPGWPARFRELRAHIGALIREDGGSGPRAHALALARLNELAAVATPAPRAVRQESGALARELAERPECAALLAVVARDAVELLTDPVARAAVRECAGDDCPIVYLDTSRGRRRRWCSSETCGNRERVARHRRRAALARS
ncbi:CGNR zinc finger domain-containing protein [Streptomyces sp. NPDC026659]|uniref:CGNR zinc finger domain-containing protein n=1 Tax=Streptomyces sp. NPDC026659 TaxID=3155123 RepID=UPI0033ED801E